MLAGEGMSQVVRSLQELLARRTYYSGDLLFSVDILRNVTDTFKRATYVPSADDVQVPPCTPKGGGLGMEKPRTEGGVSVLAGSPGDSKCGCTGEAPIPWGWDSLTLTVLSPALLPSGELHGGRRE